jgi:hypothetical protein
VPVRGSGEVFGCALKRTSPVPADAALTIDSQAGSWLTAVQLHAAAAMTPASP